MKELFERAEALERDKKFGEAALAWEEIANADPRNVEQLIGMSMEEIAKRRGGALFHASNYEEAIAVLEAISDWKKDPKILALLTRANLEAENHTRAIETGELALSLDPDAVTVKHLLARACMKQAEHVGASSGALYYQRAIDQLSDILVIYNRYDEVAKELKRHCVQKRDDSFGATMRAQFSRFERAIEQGDHSKAFDVMNDLVRVVIEHAIDIQAQRPEQTIRIADNFIQLITDYSSRHSSGLASQMAIVFAQLHCLSMWAYLLDADLGRAELALDRAINAAPTEALAFATKAQFKFVQRRFDEAAAAVLRAESLAHDQHDRVLLGATLHNLGRFDEALAWLDKVDIEALKAESYRPERSEQIVRRLRADIDEEKAMNAVRTPEEIAEGALADGVKRVLGAVGKG